MGISGRTFLLAMVAATAVTPPVGAAEPQSATADASGAQVRWTGTIEGPESVVRDVQVSVEGGSGGRCERPTCDSFALNVTGSGGRFPLKVAASADPEKSNNIDIEIVLPDGSTMFHGAPVGADQLSTTRDITIPNAADGVYEVRIFGEPRRQADYVMTYVARASLEVPPAPVAPAEPSAQPPAGAPAAQTRSACRRARAAVRHADASLRRARRAGDRRVIRRQRRALGRAKAKARRICTRS